MDVDACHDAGSSSEIEVEIDSNGHGLEISWNSDGFASR